MHTVTGCVKWWHHHGILPSDCCCYGQGFLEQHFKMKTIIVLESEVSANQVYSCHCVRVIYISMSLCNRYINTDVTVSGIHKSWMSLCQGYINFDVTVSGVDKPCRHCVRDTLTLMLLCQGYINLDVTVSGRHTALYSPHLIGQDNQCLGSHQLSIAVCKAENMHRKSMHHFGISLVQKSNHGESKSTIGCGLLIPVFNMKQFPTNNLHKQSTTLTSALCHKVI